MATDHDLAVANLYVIVLIAAFGLEWYFNLDGNTTCADIQSLSWSLRCLDGESTPYEPFISESFENLGTYAEVDSFLCLQRARRRRSSSISFCQRSSNSRRCNPPATCSSCRYLKWTAVKPCASTFLTSKRWTMLCPRFRRSESRRILLNDEPPC